MDGKAAEKLLRPDRYQVFLMIGRSQVLFAPHPWFVVNKKGIVSRWAIGLRTMRRNPRWGYINKDALPPFAGVPILWPIWKSTLVGYVEGGEGSLAARMIERIEGSYESYPYRDRYTLTGPNSNTYVQWLLDQFPESGLKLPWNAFGKGYRRFGAPVT
ncbi:MAG: hypothetical protein QOE22_581 [Candidatus Parcubacteria bacterium]|jgi:hypothetical protein|nr:hypothetical protein [Candidatus Parcubacteria bacterium]